MADDDDGRPSYAEVLDALKGRKVTDPAPDLSLPGSPSLRDAFAAFTPPGTDPDELMAALKGAQMPSVPLSQIGKANASAEGMRWCWAHERPEPAGFTCTEAADEGPAFSVPAPAEIPKCDGCGGLWPLCSCPQRRWHPAESGFSVPAPAEIPNSPMSSLPPDPSPGDLMAGFGIADMLASMTAGGVPLGSAERIIGAMLAAHGLFAAEADGQ